ncbi:MAG: alpha-hydroxy-acid oxidizing protein [Hyphomicrobiaceae bacterium]|nr:alpha-hydroxy-acid oxidizing protein [Hyphomicrobiaceae bacterium]
MRGDAEVPGRRLYSGPQLQRAVTIADLRAMARKRLPGFALEYLEGGAEEEATLARNRTTFAEWRFLPRTLVDTSRIDTARPLFGAEVPVPIVVAPTGLNGIFIAGADVMLARAAAAAGLPFAQSTMSNETMEAVAAVRGLRHWWQLYVFGPPDVHRELIGRAQRCGCEALIVTTDCQMYGNREWERRTRSSPKSLSLGSVLDAAWHLRWLASTLLPQGMPSFENIIGFVPSDRRSFFDSAYWVRSNMQRDMSWETIAEIRKLWPRTLIVKGVLSAGDVTRAAEIGADGVVISNHGGRQLDWAVAPLDVLPDARKAVGSGLTILIDGGIRRGTDVVKALALGADAVMVGRAPLYGLSAAGEAGVAKALGILREETERTLFLLGAASLRDLGPQLLVRAEGFGLVRP